MEGATSNAYFEVLIWQTEQARLWRLIARS